jgi:hypothetical protein
MTSARHLVRALQESGYKRVERFETPQPLLSWRGQPLPELAEVIVRRQSIGATADDLGFARGEGGHYEALVSDILLSRFDRRWFLKLHERYERLVAEGADAPEMFDTPLPVVKVHTTPAREPMHPPRHESRASSKREPHGEPRNEPRSEPKAEAKPPHAERAAVALSPVQQALEQLARAAAAPAQLAERPPQVELDQELAHVLRAARSAGGAKGCAPFVVGWVVLLVVGISQGSLKLIAAGTGVAIFLFARYGAKRLARMADAGAAEFRLRVRHNPELRASALHALREALLKNNTETRQLIEELLKRVSA